LHYIEVFHLSELAVTFQDHIIDKKQQKIGFSKNLNQQHQNLVEVRPKANKPTKYEAAPVKFGSCKREVPPKLTDHHIA